MSSSETTTPTETTTDTRVTRVSIYGDIYWMHR